MSDQKAAELREAIARVREELMGRCLGTWLSGSGGHARFAGDCDEQATWIELGDWRFCDKHFKADHPSMTNMVQLDTVLAAAEAWAGLQWRDPKTAPWSVDDSTPVLLVLIEGGDVRMARCDPNGRWFDDYGEEFPGIVGWLPRDALGGE